MRAASYPLLPVLALLAGCAAQGPFPSLAPRAVERELGGTAAPTGPCRTDRNESDGCYAPAAASPPAIAAPTADDPQLRSETARLLEDARRGEREFRQLLPAAAAAAARAGAAGSESWTAAQQDVSRLEAARSATVEALSALDQLVLSRSQQATSAADFEALIAAADEARRLAAAQQEELSRIGARLDPA